MNLIKITTTPLKISINVEKAKYEEAEPAVQPIDISTRHTHRVNQVNSQKIETKTPEMPKRDVFRPESVKTPVQIGYVPLRLKAVNGYHVDLANDNMIATHGGQEVSTLKQERITNEMMPQVAYIPVTTSGEAKWEPDTLNLEFESMHVDFELEAEKKKFKYIPSKISFEIEQYPSVEIEYLGDPLYFPQSANPNQDKK